MPRTKKTFPSFHHELIKSFGLILIVFLIIFSIFAIRIIFTRLETNINKLLDKSITIAWNEYNIFPQANSKLLKYLTQQTEIKNSDSAHIKELFTPLNSFDDINFWCFWDAKGNLITGKYVQNEKHPFYVFLEEQFKNALNSNELISTTELIPISYLMDLDPSLAKKASINVQNTDQNLEKFDISLFQIIAHPWQDSNGEKLGTIMIGHILNNNKIISKNYSLKIPDSFLTISTAEGIRVSTSLQAESAVQPLDFTGSQQANELVHTIKRGQRFFGQVRIAPDEIHFVVAEPIQNIQGEVIGALTVGVPSWGLASLKKDTAIYITTFAFFCIALAFYISSIMSKRFAEPIIALGEHAKEISQAQEINAFHLEIIETPTASIREISLLQQYLNNMTHSLYRKTLENKKYLISLEEDKNELRRLTIELQEANLLLEKKVGERTSHLRQAIVELREANNLKAKFLANMSHEVRTPLNSIIGFSEMLHEETYGALNITQKEYLEIIQNSAHHLLEIINDILDISLIDQDRINLNKQEINIIPLLQSVISIISTQMVNKGLSHSIEIEDKLPNIYADTTRIKQILYNLLSNAIKFTPAGGSIKIKLTHNPDEVILQVIDTGIGIKEENLNYVFDEFYQAENLYERKFEGVGLGLPLTRKLVELHQGKLKIKSTPHQGTEVTVCLPINQDNLNQVY